MKKIMSTLLCAGLLMSSCVSKHEGKESKSVQEQTVKPVILVGETLKYNYGEDVYLVSFRSKTKLHWKCLEGSEQGKEATETYKLQQIGTHRVFIAWVEADGLGVSQVLDLKTNKVYSYLKIDQELVALEGMITKPTTRQ